MRLWIAVGLASALGGSPFAPATVRSDGLGRVEMGMTVRQAEQALGTSLRIDASQDPTRHCLYARRADGGDPGVGYMVLDGAIVRIDIELKDETALRTPEGIGAGASPERVKTVYGRRAEPDAADNAGDHDLIVRDADGKGGLRFAFIGDRLAWIVVGKSPALIFSEGCL
jgi:hypothetical protein